MHSLVLEVLVAAASVASNQSPDPSHPPESPRYDLTALGFHASHIEEFDNGPAFGTSLTVLPDLDGDSAPELALGDPFRSARRGRVVVASGRTGRILGWIDGPDGEPSFGREVATIEGQDVEHSRLLVARCFGSSPAIVSVDLHDFTQHDVWKAGSDEKSFGTWFRPWGRVQDGKRITEGIVVLTSDVEQRIGNGIGEGIHAPCHLARYDVAGAMQARVDLATEKIFDALPTLTLVHSKQADDIAVVDEGGLRLLAGEDLTPRWSRQLPSKYFVRSICSPGDLDGDGRPDLVLGCPWMDVGKRVQAGVLLLVSGADGADIGEVTLNLDCEHFGFAVCADPDAPDPRPNYIVSRPCPFSTALFAYKGVDPDPQLMWKLNEDWDCPDPGWRVDTVPDLDGDGVRDLVAARASSSCWGTDRQGFVILSGKTQQKLYALERKPRGS